MQHLEMLHTCSAPARINTEGSVGTEEKESNRLVGAAPNC